MPRILCASLLLITSALGQVLAQTSMDPVSQVDPFIGTQTSALKDNGNTVPGATLPFGMLYWSPDPIEGIYRYEQPVTRGFSLMHLSGPGCGVYGDVPIFPMLGLPAQPPPALPLPYQARFRHEDEVAQPGYYSVKLDSGVDISMAAGLHSGISEVRYPAGGDEHTLLLDLSRNLTHVSDASIQIDGTHVSGSVASGGFCGLQNHYRMYFSLRAEETPAHVGTFDERRYDQAAKAAQGPRAGGYLSFSPATAIVHFKVGLSFVSAANAEANLAQEIPGWDLEKVRQAARSTWADALSHAVVSGGSADERKVFYTAMYHSLLHPTIFSDTNGEYLGFDEKVHVAKGRQQYANYSGWDIYRSQVQLITMFFPKVGSDIAQSLVADAEEGGGLPIWPVGNDESSCMVGDPSDGILASVYAFGGHDFNAPAALQAMIRGASDPSVHSRLYPERPGLAEFLSRGFISESPEHPGSASVTLEDESADFAIAHLAQELGEKSVAQQFLHRSGQWHALFDPETRYIRPRDESGAFLPAFKPENYEGFVEGNAAQYTWMVPYDLAGVVRAIGGPGAVNTRLDAYFSQNGSYALNRGPFFYIANEPSFGNPWIYNWSGAPWRTQEVVRKTLRDLFAANPAGEPGNDDLGATSSWVVFANLGLYPEIPGVAGFTINSPAFSKIKLNFDGHAVNIVSPGAPDKLYVRGVAVDGKPLQNWWIDWRTLRNAGTVAFDLASSPNKQAGEAPPSFAP
ncbi:GH92 family glycosyl hydrolase [Acidipila sp. EB88]|uniref:GH92 family glycosyl hydrolase n=1 Tax=Acidipila sp. EB88 TaxID=2305226 RepID=UPI000F5F7A4D|nr:GH92 family glycosyl hydrolase [Acidipila sp. EB88]RRA49322.1 glycoside hydrolase family 92 protein [Acidipila sp. EB88]